jgi:phosphonate transport system permease protein
MTQVRTPVDPGHREPIGQEGREDVHRATPRRPDPVPKPNSIARRWRLIVVVAALIIAHVVGWRVTNIDIPALVTGLPNMRHIVLGLLQPDLFERLKDEVAATDHVVILPAGVPGPLSVPPVSSSDGKADVRVDPPRVVPGDPVYVQGRGWPAGETIEILLVDHAGNARTAGTLEAQADGTINFAFYAPAWGQGAYEVRVVHSTARFAWRPTQTLILSVRLMIETLFLALMGTSLAVLFTLPLSFLGARTLMGKTRTGRAVYYVTRAIFNLLRSIEVVIVVTIMAVVVGIGSFAGVLAIVVHSIGALGKLYSEAIEDIDPGPLEAIAATGARPVQIVRYGVIPQVIPQFLSFTLYRMDINVRMSTIVGLVGGGGIGFILTQYINLLQWQQAGTAIWLIAIVVTAIDYLSAWLREKII